MNATPFRCFVTGTDTDVGKTLVSSALLHALVQTGASAVGMKPIAAGCTTQQGRWRNDDIEQLRAAGNVAIADDLRCQYLFEPFCAPHIAAAQVGVEIEMSPILNAYQSLCTQSEALLVEGVGGFRVPLSSRVDTADLAQQLSQLAHLPLILVVGLRLGCINHALLTVEAIAARGLQLAGWVANQLDADMPYVAANIAALTERIPAPLLGCVPRLSAPSAAAVAAYLDFSVLPNWPTAPSVGKSVPH